MSVKRTIDTFTEKAQAVSAVVAKVKSLDEAYNYVVDLCEKKEACQLLISGCGEQLSQAAGDLCEAKQEKVIAAPGLATKEFNKLKKLSDKKGFVLIKDGLRERLAGIDIGFTMADMGVAETATLIIDSRSEELRLATMVSEVHVAVLPVSKVADTMFDIEKDLAALIKDSPGYVACISGASRTADIERVLAIGVHGPLELHVLLLEDK